jgi:hypothetical protein
VIVYLADKPHGTEPIAPGIDGTDHQREIYNQLVKMLEYLDAERYKNVPQLDFIIDVCVGAAHMLWMRLADSQTQ